MARKTAKSKIKARLTDLVASEKKRRKERKAGQRRDPCPACKSEEGYFNWGGSVKKTTYTCASCNSEYPALDLFDEIYVKVIASPIDEKYTVGG